MTKFKMYEGRYQMDGTVVLVAEVNGRLTSAFPGMPPGFEVVLLPLDVPHHFRMIGGPTDGATAVFHFDEQNKPQSILVGNEFELLYTEKPENNEIASGHGLLPPELLLDDEKRHAFSTVMTEVVLAGTGDLIEWQLPYPKHEFLQFLAMQNQFIFHGSNNREIAEFSTRRTSVELKDRSGRGNKQAVYGTHDGLWPLFFAIVDRSNMSGSIRNGFMSLQNEAGEEQRMYHFTINEQILAERPYTQGAVYILPRQTFEQIPFGEGSLSNEWASEQPVKPLAKLFVEPEAFPFLELIGGHDDSEMIRASELNTLLYERVEGYIKTGSRFAFKLNWDEAFGRDLLDLIAIHRVLFPVGERVVRFVDDQEVWFEIVGPPAYEQVIQNRLDELGKPIL